MDSTFQIQGRQEPVWGSEWLPAVTTGIAIYEDEALDLPTIQVSIPNMTDTAENVEYFGGPTGDACPVQLFVDGVSLPISGGSGSSKASVEAVSKWRIIVEYPSTGVKLEFGIGSWKGSCLFSVDYIFSDCRAGERIVGLLGSPNGEWRDDWMTQDGTPVDIVANNREAAYTYTQNNWCT